MTNPRRYSGARALGKPQTEMQANNSDNLTANSGAVRYGILGGITAPEGRFEDDELYPDGNLQTSKLVGPYLPPCAVANIARPRSGLGHLLADKQVPLTSSEQDYNDVVPELTGFRSREEHQVLIGSPCSFDRQGYAKRIREGGGESPRCVTDMRKSYAEMFSADGLVPDKWAPIAEGEKLSVDNLHGARILCALVSRLIVQASARQPLQCTLLTPA